MEQYSYYRTPTKIHKTRSKPREYPKDIVSISPDGKRWFSPSTQMKNPKYAITKGGKYMRIHRDNDKTNGHGKRLTPVTEAHIRHMAGIGLPNEHKET